MQEKIAAMFPTSRQEYTTLVLDLGGVLANYSTKNAFKLPASLIKSALDCPDWHDYEKGLTSEAECYVKICKEFNIDLETWAEVLEQMRQGLIINKQLISSIKDLKQAYPSMTVVCLSNIPAPELDALSGEIESWGIIDYFIASSAVTERKPDTVIYMKCLDIVKSSASSSIFIDDKIDRVVAAQALGFKGIVFNNNDDITRQLQNLFGDPLKRAKDFLRRNAKNLFCTLSTGQVQPDNYSQLIILQNTGDRYVNSCASCLPDPRADDYRDLVVLESEGPTWNYFQRESPTLSMLNAAYPNDSDTTSLAMVVLEDTPMSLKLQARDEILSHLSPDGLPFVSFTYLIAPQYLLLHSAGSAEFVRGSAMSYAPMSSVSSLSTTGSKSSPESTTSSVVYLKLGLTSTAAAITRTQTGSCITSQISVPDVRETHSFNT